MIPTQLRMTMGKAPPPVSANEQLCRNVRELMKLRRWSQADLAKRIGVSQPWLSQRFTGRTSFHMRDLDAIALAFDVTPAELLCVGFGQWDRRKTPDRRSGEDRRGSMYQKVYGERHDGERGRASSRPSSRCLTMM